MKPLDVLGLGEVPLPTHRARGYVASVPGGRSGRQPLRLSSFMIPEWPFCALVQDAPGGLMSAAQDSYFTARSSSASGLLQAPVEALLSALLHLSRSCRDLGRAALRV